MVFHLHHSVRGGSAYGASGRFSISNDADASCKESGGRTCQTMIGGCRRLSNHSPVGSATTVVADTISRWRAPARCPGRRRISRQRARISANRGHGRHDVVGIPWRGCLCGASLTPCSPPSKVVQNTGQGMQKKNFSALMDRDNDQKDG